MINRDLYLINIIQSGAKLKDFSQAKIPLPLQRKIEEYQKTLWGSRGKFLFEKNASDFASPRKATRLVFTEFN
jgi:hypothetical protein